MGSYVNGYEAPGANGGGSRTGKPTGLPYLAHQAISLLASLRLTVILFVFSILLIFIGTLAQINYGLYTVLHDYFRTTIAWIPYQLFVQFGQIFLGFPKTWDVAGTFPFPGGKVIGSLLLINLLAAHLVRFKLSWKRSGILLIHSGLVVLMLGEMITASYSVEARMVLPKGASADFVEEHQAFELAVVDSSGSGADNVVSIPASRLRKGGLIQSDMLPFDIEVQSYLMNSALQDARPGVANPATVGFGRDWVAVPLPEESGTSMQREDVPSAYLTIKDKATGRAMETLLLTGWLTYRYDMPQRPQQVTQDGKTYDLYLRHKRIYKPYTVELLEFRHDVYPGTDIAKNYSSRVRVTDPTENEDREVVIWMNNPHRHAGDTLYQSGVLGGGGTILQVVRNPGLELPYVSCVMVASGMIVHFLIHLVGFLRRKIATRAEPEELTGFSRLVPGLVMGLAGLYLVMAAMPSPTPAGQTDFAAFSRLPVMDRGRIKPLDTVARVDLMVISGRQVLRDPNGKEVTAVKWLLDVLTSEWGFENHAAYREKAFRIDNDQLLGMLGLEMRPGKYRYALNEFRGKLDVLDREYARARNLEAKKREVFDQKVVEVHDHIRLFMELASLNDLLMIPPTTAEKNWQTLIGSLRSDASIRQALADEKSPEKILRSYRDLGRELPPAVAYLAMFKAYAGNKADEFNRLVADYHAQLEKVMPEVMRTARWEASFNHFAPFYHCAVLYAGVFLLASMSWLTYTVPLRCAAFWLAILTLAVHSAALIMRMYLQGRPPVTNLYATQVFVGWGCLVMALVLEWLFQNGIGSMVAAVLGFSTMLMANHLAGGGDTLDMMQAVLDTNFWLATHVTIINFGYAATLVSGALGVLYVLLGVFTPWFTPELAKAMSQKIYGMVCFAVLLTFTGTVLGGIWADQSWGRFWGWDPKENGALILVIWNALILHARWSGMAKQRGVAVLAIAGNMLTLWSWHGTNQLGVGLHAYGFNSTLAQILVWCWLGHLLVIGAGCLPPRYWRSFAATPSKRIQPTLNEAS